MALKRLTLIRGDTQTYTLAFKGGTAGTAYNLKNWMVFFTMKTSWSLPDAQASVHKSQLISIDTPTGIAVVSLAPEDTVNLEPGEYDFDIAVRTAANETFTVMRGKMDLEYDVTRTAGTAGTA
jgi:hypothetical protein